MLIQIAHPHPIKPSEITPETVYEGRRRFLVQLGLVTASAALAGCGVPASDDAAGSGLSSLEVTKKGELAGNEKVSAYEDITHYNNFYEFGTAKEDPARNAGRLRTRPWSVIVDGECEAPGRIDLDDLIKPQALEERIYRHRCVEAWSMVAPWIGVPLADVLKRFKPTSRAKFVAFYTLFDPQQMPETTRGVLNWPYREGLRIDEAMHPLAFLSVGLYGRVLPNQNGAPLRLTLPWKYGSKVSSPSFTLSSSNGSRKRPGINWHRRSTASTQTSIPRSIIRAGVSRMNVGWGSCSSARRCCSTAIRKSLRFTRVWT